MSGTPNNVTAGPGWLFVAPYLDTLPAFPTDVTTPLGTTYVPVGYTEEGNTFSYAVTREDLLVAEEVSPVKSYTTKVDTKVTFSMAEATAANLILALNGGVVATPTEVEPPALGAEQYVTLVLDTDSGARWLFRKCIQTGTVEIGHKKAPAKTLIPVEFTVYVPSAELALFTVFLGTDGLV